MPFLNRDNSPTLLGFSDAVTTNSALKTHILFVAAYRTNPPLRKASVDTATNN